jgi:hypothetical protein
MFVTGIVLAMVAVIGVLAQGPASGPDMTIDAGTRAAVIEGALKAAPKNWPKRSPRTCRR